MALSVLLVALLLLLIIGLPLPYSLGAAGLAGLVAIGDGIPLTVIPQRFVSGIDSFAFMAIPFFLLLGDLMNAAGITRRIIALSNSMVGHLPGGLAHVNVVSSMFFGGISGSATADTASIGSILIPAMKKEGYDSSYSVAITAASSTAGPIIPPSILLVLYGVISGTSITSLFVAGYVPGLMLAAGLLFINYIMAKRHGYPIHSRASFRDFLVALKNSAWAVFMPFLIIGGMLSGVFTVTEAAGVSVVYGLFVGLFIYRELKVREIPAILGRAMIKVGTLMTVAASALIFAWVLTILEVPQMLAAQIFTLTENPLVILLMLNLLFLFIGMFMEAKAAMLILLPVVLPLVPQVGIDLVHFGIIIVFNLLIGLVTPPIGLCLNLAAKIGEVRIDQAAIAALPMIGVMLVVLIIVTYLPGVVLWLPRFLN